MAKIVILDTFIKSGIFNKKCELCKFFPEFCNEPMHHSIYFSSKLKSLKKMRRTISFKGEVLYILEKKSTFDNDDLCNPDDPDYEWEKLDSQNNEWQRKQWINVDKNG